MNKNNLQVAITHRKSVFHSNSSTNDLSVFYSILSTNDLGVFHSISSTNDLSVFYSISSTNDLHVGIFYSISSTNDLSVFHSIISITSTIVCILHQQKLIEFVFATINNHYVKSYTIDNSIITHSLLFSYTLEDSSTYSVTISVSGHKTSIEIISDATVQVFH